MNDNDCGHYPILFALKLIHGHDPNQEEFHVTCQDILDLRFKVAIRFACGSPSLSAATISLSNSALPLPSGTTELASNGNSAEMACPDLPFVSQPVPFVTALFPVAIPSEAGGRKTCSCCKYFGSETFPPTI
jgi:hypothetical protein